jgi:hypothetical protein
MEPVMLGSYCARHDVPLSQGGCVDCDVEVALYFEVLDAALESNPELFGQVEGR